VTGDYTYVHHGIGNCSSTKILFFRALSNIILKAWLDNFYKKGKLWKTGDSRGGIYGIKE
jgi:hypothetical protein